MSAFHMLYHLYHFIIGVTVVYVRVVMTGKFATNDAITHTMVDVTVVHYQITVSHKI